MLQLKKQLKRAQHQASPKMNHVCSAETLQCVWSTRELCSTKGQLRQDAMGAFGNLPCTPQEEAAVIILSGTEFLTTPEGFPLRTGEAMSCAL